MKKRVVLAEPACIRRCSALVVALSLSLSLGACGGGGGGVATSTPDENVSNSSPAPDTNTSPTGSTPAATPAATPSLVDGRVGDSPFYDDGFAGGLADGLASADDNGTAPVAITWAPVTTQLDHQPEFELAGYRLYYGHQAGKYEYVIEVANPNAQGYTVSGLPSGTYYFAATAVDIWNKEGPFSNEAAISVN